MLRISSIYYYVIIAYSIQYRNMLLRKFSTKLVLQFFFFLIKKEACLPLMDRKWIASCYAVFFVFRWDPVVQPYQYNFPRKENWRRSQMKYIPDFLINIVLIVICIRRRKNIQNKRMAYPGTWYEWENIVLICSCLKWPLTMAFY